MAGERYPLPDYAVNVWVAGDNLMVAFPGTRSEQGHTIKLPVSEGGLKTALSILRHRADVTDLRLGHDGTPTQYDVEAGKAWGKVTRREREAREAAKAQKTEDEIAYKAARERRIAKERATAARELEELGL